MRKVGHQIRAAMDASEASGKWLRASELFRLSGINVAPTVCTKVLRRAVAYGLMEADESGYPILFRALPGWRVRIEKTGGRRAVNRPKHPPVVKPRIPAVANSVFALGSMMGGA